MRIIAGQWRGRPIEAPPGQGTRPTSDRAREGLFSMLTSRLGGFEGLRVADLFAGTGALGLEALSRGAAYCTFVEKDRKALDILERNIARLGAADRSDLRPRAVEHVAPPSLPHDIVFMDPPYGTAEARKALDQIAAGGWVAPGGWVSVETARGELDVPEGLERDAERKFGKARIILLRRSA